MHSKCRSLILLYLFAGTSVATAESLIDRTPELTSCLACHGQKAEGNQIRRALGGHDPRDPRHPQHVAFRDGGVADQLRRLGSHLHCRPRSRPRGGKGTSSSE